MARNTGRRLAEWAPARRGAVLCYLHLPARPATAAVVVCSPLFLEASENVGAEIRLADALVERGIGVARFDYRGSGNSQGDAAALTLASAQEDCRLAARLLRERAGTDVVGVLGTRWSALVAAGAVADVGARAVAFWEAKPDGSAYAGELVRTRAFTGLWRGEDGSAAAHAHALAEGRALDILGWRVHPALVASSRHESVAGRMARPVPARVVYGRGRRADGERLSSALSAAGCPVTVAALPERALWWVGLNPIVHPEHPRSPLEDEAEATAGWLAENLAA